MRKMFSRKKQVLKGNLAFMPLVVLVEFLGFHVEAQSNKVFRLIQSSTLLILLLIVSHFIRFNVGTNAVVATIAYTNTRCIYFALIIIYIRNMIATESLGKVFKCFDNIDLRLQRTFDIKIKCDDSKWIYVTLLLLFTSAFSSLAFECYNDKTFNVGQLVHAMLVFILSVKILYYCMFCASIKLRFKALIKYLKDIKSSQTLFAAEAKATKYVAAKSIRNVSQLKEISLIYDELLEIILLLNESFSSLLSFAFGEWCGIKDGE